MIQTMQRVLIGCALLLGATMNAAADDSHDHHGGHDHGAPGVGAPTAASPNARTVAIVLIDNAFEPSAVTVRTGETVRFTLKNSGQLLHEFNIGTAAMHAEHQQEMARLAESGLITVTGIAAPPAAAHDHHDHGATEAATAPVHDHANSVLLAPGATAELVWTFAEAGVLEFACNVPGHYEAGMVGKVEFVR